MLTPVALAMAAAVQWVASCAGSVLVRATTRSMVSIGTDGMREGRVLSRTKPSTPSSMNRSCQRQTQVLSLPVAAMMAFVPTPSAVSMTIRARQTCFWGLLRSHTIVSRRSRSLGVTVMEVPVRMPQIRTATSPRESQTRSLMLGRNH